ncbi:MAG: hypothetical protein DRG30_07695 [Epsilonproteobacteria bacterium]|nr:MAG: hypothetical protein DRG30_07695 [Campylobacterota bacterium]
MSTTILTCGNFSVRSSKAVDRINTATTNSLSINTACYQFTGCPESAVSLNGKRHDLTADDNDLVYSTAQNCPALFFDQTPYMFSIKFPGNTIKAYLFSPLAAWCDSADWDSDTGRLVVPINFGNDLGDFELCWEWETDDGERHNASFSGQVFSTKLDIYEHFNIMLDEVTERFEWIRLDLLRQTTWGWSHDDTDGNLKTWLLIFQEVQSNMDRLLRKLIKQHRRRLIPEVKMQRPDRIRKISSKNEERIVRGIRENSNHRYPVEKKILDADTPENRFIKYILRHTLTQLHELLDKIEPLSRIADIFKARLREWTDSWGELKQQRFWRGIGEFHGLQRESLVLSQDPLYAGIRCSWYLLQHGLKFMGQDLYGGIQNAAQLYEIWCLVKMDQLIIGNGWKCVDNRIADFELDGDDFEGEELQSGTGKFSYKKEGLEHIELELLFQPTAANKPAGNSIWDGMMALPVVQKPDIVLRLHRKDLPNQPVYTWIFDAKYRLNGNDAPDDAVNQMHRYRDAIVWADETGSRRRLTRESIGAYVLYPGNGAELSKQSPQIASIGKTNIGAFPLRPDRDGKDFPQLLKNRLETFLTIQKDYFSVQENQDRYFAAVPDVKRKTGDIFAKCITKAAEGMNTEGYWKTCRLYRLPDRVVQREGLQPKIWTYLIPTAADGKQLGNFPILTVKKMKRDEIKKLYDNKQVTMHNKRGADNDVYWLFELGDPLENMPELDVIEKRKVVLLGEAVGH